ncbi:hypothetical protein [Pediococcus ethanolidurans]|uniref:Uncharacterized protein n=1 Tax=Pediococcus ethanolidurans TaxID=319653 RepID=A0A0R2K9A2_9LACO|nr:hypothetical protein [Pediococcus ethanolidurans]KRN82868.1 hypothetical protein IV87_GL001819 [Pediococcus ethanolidurans]MCV3315607.1 hypothetical protein [Pediococcus ethanolidurans]GEN94722.1 hypothetical protein PET01_07720 [Pediococcus ethanolidurans]SER18656.1 hypothetical protein SAMN04487973_102179 [Pediococcus ethanolidurans]
MTDNEQRANDLACAVVSGLISAKTSNGFDVDALATYEDVYKKALNKFNENHD